ncbi:hypothetical protein AAHB37_16275 [Glutamicibacter halophytocola]|uniref:hypothetical protein n=1 Tax=Glutamicibacter halophytocola TaxID=1933880 RepID=UPI00321A5311
MRGVIEEDAAVFEVFAVAVGVCFAGEGYGGGGAAVQLLEVAAGGVLVDDVDFGLVGEGCLVVAQGGDGAFQAGDAGEAFLGGSVFLDVCQARFQSFDHGGESVVVFGVGGFALGGIVVSDMFLFYAGY